MTEKSLFRRIKEKASWVLRSKQSDHEGSTGSKEGSIDPKSLIRTVGEFMLDIDEKNKKIGERNFAQFRRSIRGPKKKNR